MKFNLHIYSFSTILFSSLPRKIVVLGGNGKFLKKKFYDKTFYYYKNDMIHIIKIYTIIILIRTD